MMWLTAHCQLIACARKIPTSGLQREVLGHYTRTNKYDAEFEVVVVSIERAMVVAVPAIEPKAGLI